MRIRSQLFLLVAAVLAPVALLAAVSLERLWHLQREAHGQQFLERVSALRLAQDTEIEAVLADAMTLADIRDLTKRLPAFEARFRRNLETNPRWSTLGLARIDGTPVARVDRQPLPADAVPDRRTLARVARTGTAATSNLVSTADGQFHLTYIVAPARHIGDGMEMVFFIGIESHGWLEFLRRYPISKDATLTLNDANGRIIARTLNNERWVGKTSSPTFWNQTLGRPEGTFISPGLEGQSFYSAFSRSPRTGWMVGTGVPQDQVEANLRWPTILMIGGAALAAVLVAFFALYLGRRIAGALTSLADAARAAATHAPVPSARLAIDEAETVRSALAESSDLLRERERSLNEALRNEERSGKAKDEFLAMLGHELRNPLSAMSSAATVLELAPEDSEATRRSREILQRQLRHLSDIVDDMLDVARLTTGKVVLNKVTLDLAVATRHVLEAFRDSGRCAHLKLETSLEPAGVFADETRLEQVIANLLDNACKYTPAGRRVRIAVGVAGAEAVLTVVDEGSGIAPELLPYVFDIFSQGARTLDRAQGGLGLGLAVVRRLVELHGGTVRAQSAGLERGATFTVRLPLAVAGVREDGAAPLAQLAPLRVVLIEDNADNRESIAEVLRMKGHAVIAADDGIQGVAAIVDARPQVALVDIGLPGIDGLEVARRVRATAGRKAVLVALTGYGAEADRQQALAAGFDAFLIKPFSLPRFEAAVLAARSELAADLAVERVRPAAA